MVVQDATRSVDAMHSAIVSACLNSRRFTYPINIYGPKRGQFILGKFINIAKDMRGGRVKKLPPTEHLLHSIQAVSYTHLDVYKRQPL